MTLHRVRIRLNGAAIDATVPAERLLIDLLREDLGLTGTKLGCGVGVCGACTVLVDGAPMTACLILAAMIDGRSVRTIEGVRGERPSALQDAFVREGGSQCGICTPGQVLAATALLEGSPRPSDEEIRDGMKGNLCRCTGYYGIVRAIRAASTRS